MNEILAGDGRGIAGTAIGDAKHELMACELTVAFVKGRLDLFLAVDEFDVLDVRSHDEIRGYSNDGTYSLQTSIERRRLPYLS